MLRVNGTFELSKGKDDSPKTTGIWLYTEPITIEKEGEILDIFLMDCECFQHMPNDLNRIKLYTLVVSLCSFLIYNTKDLIRDSHFIPLQNLRSKSAPQFLWLLRDLDVTSVKNEMEKENFQLKSPHKTVAE